MRYAIQLIECIKLPQLQLRLSIAKEASFQNDDILDDQAFVKAYLTLSSTYEPISVSTSE